MTADIFWYFQQCPEFQWFKKQQKKLWDVPVGVPVVIPGEVVAVDLTGPWTIPTNYCAQHMNHGGSASDTSLEPEPLQLTCLTIIDLATQWNEIVHIDDKDACTVAFLIMFGYLAILRVWIVAFKFQELLYSYGILSPTMVKKPTANAVLEHTHQTRYAQLIHKLSTLKVDEVFDDLIAAVYFCTQIWLPYFDESYSNTTGFWWQYVLPDNKLASATSSSNDANGSG
jgi:hypothetical protein